MKHTLHLMVGAAALGCSVATPTATSAPTAPAEVRIPLPAVTPTADPAFPITYHALVFDPSDPSRLWFTFGDFMLMSTSGGTEWTPQLPSATRGPILYAAEYPAGGRLYQAGRGVFRRSADAGETWESVSDLGAAAVKGLTSLPNDADSLLVLVDGEGLHRSEDAGETWSPVASDIPDLAFGLWPVKADPLRLASVNRDGMVPLVSDDGGTTWVPLASTGMSGELRTIDLAPDGTAYAATDAGLFASTDGGDTWEERGSLSGLVAVAVSPADPLEVIVVNGAGQVLKSTDGGVSW